MKERLIRQDGDADLAEHFLHVELALRVEGPDGRIEGEALLVGIDVTNERACRARGRIRGQKT
jgi:hypothetical protein